MTESRDEFRKRMMGSLANVLKDVYQIGDCPECGASVAGGISGGEKVEFKEGDGTCCHNCTALLVGEKGEDGKLKLVKLTEKHLEGMDVEDIGKLFEVKQITIEAIELRDGIRQDRFGIMKKVFEHMMNKKNDENRTDQD